MNQIKQQRIANHVRGRHYSRRMRRYPTETEYMLATALKKQKYRFTQQAIMCDEHRLYIADFLIRSSHGDVVVEVDGPGHCDRAAYDAERDRWIWQHRRYRILRFTSLQVFKELPKVLAVIDRTVGRLF